MVTDVVLIRQLDNGVWKMLSYATVMRTNYTKIILTIVVKRLLKSHYNYTTSGSLPHVLIIYCVKIILGPFLCNNAVGF